MEAKTKTRRYEISFLNVIFCLLVIFIHIISYAVAHFAPGSIAYNLSMFPWRLSSFVVQGFVMLSGIKLFLTKKDSISYIEWLKLRFKSIVIPYILCFIIYYIFYYIVYDYPLNLKFVAKQFFTGNLVCHLYFIPIMVQFDLLFPLFKRIINNCSPVIIIPFCFLISQIFEVHFPTMLSTLLPDIKFMYNDRLFTTYLSFYVTGCYIGKYYESFLNILKTNFKTISGCFILSTLLFLYYTYLAFNNIAQIPFINQVHSLYVICVILFLYSLSVKYASQFMEKSKFFKKIDAVSYDIYLWHMLILFGTNYILEKLGIFSQLYSFIIRIIIVYGITISFCFILKKIKSLSLFYQIKMFYRYSFKNHIVYIKQKNHWY